MELLRKRRHKPGTLNGVPIYPWDEWLRPGAEFSLSKGVHYDCTEAGMIQQVRQRANDRKLYVRIRRSADRGTFSVTVSRRPWRKPNAKAAAAR